MIYNSQLTLTIIQYIIKTDDIVGFYLLSRKEVFILKEEKQKVGQIKKKKIREAAKKCFLTKGFQAT